MSQNGGDGLKEGSRLFREASGAFDEFSRSVDLVPDLACTMDVQRDSANMLSALMLAQAQACFYQVAVDRGMSSGLLAKLAVGTAELFQEVCFFCLWDVFLKWDRWEFFSTCGTFFRVRWVSHKVYQLGIPRGF